jgi:hypothetical protein
MKKPIVAKLFALVFIAAASNAAALTLDSVPLGEPTWRYAEPLAWDVDQLSGTAAKARLKFDDNSGISTVIAQACPIRDMSSFDADGRDTSDQLPVDNDGPLGSMAAVVPEPSGLVLLSSALIGLALSKTRKKS